MVAGATSLSSATGAAAGARASEMPRPRIVDDSDIAELRRVAHVRASLPTNKELADRIGCAERTVEHYISEFMREAPVSCETESERIEG